MMVEIIIVITGLVALWLWLLKPESKHKEVDQSG